MNLHKRQALPWAGVTTDVKMLELALATAGA